MAYEAADTVTELGLLRYRSSSAVDGYQRSSMANSLPGSHSRLIASTAAARDHGTSASCSSATASAKKRSSPRRRFGVRLGSVATVVDPERAWPEQLGTTGLPGRRRRPGRRKRDETGGGFEPGGDWLGDYVFQKAQRSQTPREPHNLSKEDFSCQ